MTTEAFDFRIVCGTPAQQASALLLAASVRAFADPSDHLSMFALPGVAGDETRLALGRMRATVVEHEASSRSLRSAALGARGQGARIVVLDAATLLSRPLVRASLRRSAIQVAAIDVQPNFRGGPGWDAIHAATGTAARPDRVAGTVCGRTGPLCFDEGVIVVDASVAEALAMAWSKHAEEIRTTLTLDPRAPSAEVLALALAIGASNASYEVLGREAVFPAHLLALPAMSLPGIVRYASSDVIASERSLLSLVSWLVASDPSVRASLDHVGESSWSRVINRLTPTSAAAVSTPPAPAPPSPDPVFITGIPRSGTSFLCSAVSKLENSVALNEPLEVFDGLRTDIPVSKLAACVRDLRARVRDGIPIENKLKNGEVAEDTWRESSEQEDSNARRPTVVDVVNDAFLLAIKNPLLFLLHLPELRREFPTAKIALCVRNPFDTIASWKETFPHLREARIPQLGSSVWLPGHRRELLREIREVPDLAWRRALLWRALADIIVDEVRGPDRNMVLVPYERAVADPVPFVAELVGSNALAWRTQPLPSSARSRGAALDDADYRAIRAVCLPVASELGVITDRA